MNEQTSHVVFYNIWGHRVPEGINEYLQSLADSADVICLTEVTNMVTQYVPPPAVHTNTNLSEPPAYINGLEQVIRTVGDVFATHYYATTLEDWKCEVREETYKDIEYGSALLVRRGLNVLATGAIPVRFSKPKIKPRVLQYVVYQKNGCTYLVAHLHGVWLKENTKGDDPARSYQSRFVLEHLSYLEDVYRVDEMVFGGDLNLALDTLAIKLLEENYRNLIREHWVQNTRTSRYRKYDDPRESKHADYVFVSKGATVTDFRVRNEITASDHAPLEVVFS